MTLKVKKDKTETYILEISGEIDLYHSDEIKTLVDAMIKKGVKKLIFDFNEAYYIDSSGLGALIYLFQKSRKDTSLRFVMINVKNTVKNVIELTGLNKFFTIKKELDDALVWLND